MFTEPDRAAVLDALLADAREDPAISAAALVGSAARHETDRWSDIDLALRLRPDEDARDRADAWTERVDERFEVADRLDVWAGPALYRVLLLADSLQVDVSFWPDAAFGSTGEPFQLLFGEASAASPGEPADPLSAVRRGWLIALHARSAIGRARRWQAMEMLGALRNELVALACIRHGLPPFEGRGVDRLPSGDLAALLRTVPSEMTPGPLANALGEGLDLLLGEAARVDPRLAARLRPALRVMRESVGPSGDRDRPSG